MTRQFLDQLAHALRMQERQRGKINAAGYRMLDRVAWERYCLCCELGLGVEAATLVVQHRFEVAR